MLEMQRGHRRMRKSSHRALTASRGPLLSDIFGPAANMSYVYSAPRRVPSHAGLIALLLSIDQDEQSMLSRK